MHLKKCNGIILARVVMMEERQEARSMKAPCAGCSAENLPFSSQVWVGGATGPDTPSGQISPEKYKLLSFCLNSASFSP